MRAWASSPGRKLDWIPGKGFGRDSSASSMESDNSVYCTNLADVAVVGLGNN